MSKRNSDAVAEVANKKARNEREIEVLEPESLSHAQERTLYWKERLLVLRSAIRASDTKTIAHILFALDEKLLEEEHEDDEEEDDAGEDSLRGVRIRWCRENEGY